MPHRAAVLGSAPTALEDGEFARGSALFSALWRSNHLVPIEYQLDVFNHLERLLVDSGTDPYEFVGTAVSEVHGGTILSPQGMPIEDYLRLMRELLSKKEHQDLLSLFAEAGSQIGVSVEELVQGIRRNPDAAVRMLSVAAELDSIAGVNQESSRNRLAQCINAVCKDVAATEGRAVATAEERASTIAGLEDDLLLRLLQAGADPAVVGGVRTVLEGSRPGAEPDKGELRMPGSAQLGETDPGRVAPLVSSDSETQILSVGSAGTPPADARATQEARATQTGGASIRPALLGLAAELGAILPSLAANPTPLATLIAEHERTSSPGSADVDAFARTFIDELRAAGIPGELLDTVADKVGWALRRAFSSTGDAVAYESSPSAGSVMAALAQVVAGESGTSGSTGVRSVADVLAGVDAAHFAGFVGLAAEIGSLLGTNEQLQPIVNSYLQRLSESPERGTPVQAQLTRDLRAAGDDAFGAARAKLAEHLLSRVRELDKVGTVGSPGLRRFLVVLPNTDLQGAHQAVLRLSAPDSPGVAPVYSVLGPPDSDTVDESKYLTLVKAEHRRAVKQWTQERRLP